ncbi:MAG: sodium:proton exchanger [Acidobacteria bacterium]|nr:MAG: sodium:proton exchanger [Acidobacteriota bacterium]
MHGEPGGALILAIALAVGMAAQAIARHLRVPGIVLLLAAGVAIGPDGAGLVDPRRLGGAVPALVGFAVAVILFEGGLNLNLARLMREARVIRRLVTVGALVTAVGGALSARLLMGWDLRLSALFGSLVIVTGPTVVTPLLRRLRIRRDVATVLEAEGVLIDAIGAVAAMVALEVALAPSGASLLAGLGRGAGRLGAGVAIGGAGGALLALALRARRVVPEGLANVFTLSFVLLLFQLSDSFLPESGIAAATAAGLVTGNVRTRVSRDLQEFKEQLTVMFIGMLFVLLAAGVRLEEVRALGWRAAATVAALVLVVRPAQVLLATAGTKTPWRERVLLAWLAPRGIVAAAVASLFAQELDAAGIPGGPRLQALVFLVIAITVTLAGLTGGVVAGLLGLRRPAREGWLVLGANPLGLLLGRALRDAGEAVVFVDANPDSAQDALDGGFPVVFGNALEERTLLRAEVETRAGCVAVTPNDEVNLLFADKVREIARGPDLYVALRHGHGSVSPGMVHDLDAKVLFGAPRTLDRWARLAERGEVSVETWVAAARIEPSAASLDSPAPLVPLAVCRGRKAAPAAGLEDIPEGTRVVFAIEKERREEAESWLREAGFAPAAGTAAE